MRRKKNDADPHQLQSTLSHMLPEANKTPFELSLNCWITLRLLFDMQIIGYSVILDEFIFLLIPKI